MNIEELIDAYLETLPGGEYDDREWSCTPREAARRILLNDKVLESKYFIRGGIVKGFLPWLREQDEKPGM